MGRMAMPPHGDPEPFLPPSDPKLESRRQRCKRVSMHSMWPLSVQVDKDSLPLCSWPLSHSVSA